MTASLLIDPVVAGPFALPNRALAARPGITRSPPDLATPLFALPASRVADLWVEVVEAQPRAAIVSRGADGLTIHAIQRTPMLGFVDDVHARILPLGRDEATIALLSVSRVGLWDLGVNRARLVAWLADLEARAARWSGGGGPL
jgi:uncharacterized protein (DUF1499 family)